MSINGSFSFQADNKTNYFSAGSPSVIPIAFACGSGLAFVALVIFFQCIFNRIDAAANSEIRAVRQHGCTHGGLSRIVMSSLPTFKYNNKERANCGSDSDVCSVCLEPFQEAEIVRELPRCRHLFHIECIDMWLYSHITCPLCRSIIGVKEGKKKAAAVELASELPPV